MSKLKPHQLFYIQHFCDSMTADEIASELGTEVKPVVTAIKRINKERMILEAASATESVSRESEPVVKKKVADIPPAIPGHRPSTIVMNEALSAQYDNFKPHPVATPRLKKCVDIIDENAPVY